MRVAASASALTVARQGRGFGPSSRQYFRTSDYLAQQLGEGHRGVVFVERATLDHRCLAYVSGPIFLTAQLLPSKAAEQGRAAGTVGTRGCMRGSPAFAATAGSTKKARPQLLAPGVLLDSWWCGWESQAHYRSARRATASMSYFVALPITTVPTSCVG